MGIGAPPRIVGEIEEIYAPAGCGDSGEAGPDDPARQDANAQRGTRD